MGHTTDPNHPGLGYGSDTEPTEQHKVYLILSEDERSKGFLQPVRDTYLHLKCGTTTTMSREIAETYARDPGFYGSTYCIRCRKHLPVGENGEFVWSGTDQKVGTIAPVENPKPAKQVKKGTVKKDPNGWIPLEQKEPPLNEWVEFWEIAIDGSSGMKVYRRVIEGNGESFYNMRDMDGYGSPRDGKLTHWRPIIGPKI